MVIDNTTAKRYAVYVFYDKDGIADEYNFYLLKELRKSVSFIEVMVNGKITDESLKKFEEIAEEVLIRPNEGLDITAYKEGLFRYGEENLRKYDEAIVLNSTFFGPIHPFEEMFEDMAGRDLDFWGISVFHGAPFDPMGTIKYHYIPKHIQSYFMVFRKSLLMSDDFTHYWCHLQKIHNYQEAVGFHETIFTKDMEDLGYKWAAYLDPPEMDGITWEALRDFPRYCMEEKRCPIMKRRSFFQDFGESVDRSGGEATREGFDYIRDHTDYDVNMIWDNLLRLQNMADLKKRLCLNFVCSSKIRPQKKPALKTALFLYIYYSDLAGYCASYAANMPEGTDIYVSVPGEEEKKHAMEVFAPLETAHRVEYRVVDNRGRDIGPFLTGMKDVVMDYDLVLKMHDKKTTHSRPWTIGRSWSYELYENLMKSEAFIENVMALFEKNPRMGILAPPVPVHGPYYPTAGANEWGENFPVTKELADRMGLHVNLDPDKEPVAPFGDMFYFRPKALVDLFDLNLQYEDYPGEPLADDATLLHAIERVFPFCAQNQGYYTGWLLADTFAPMEFDSLNHMNQGMEFSMALRDRWWDHRTMLMNLDMLDRTPEERRELEDKQMEERHEVLRKWRALDEINFREGRLTPKEKELVLERYKKLKKLYDETDEVVLKERQAREK
ncbi:MAG: rhamnan synthesis F family protein [Lachnospiraceae bacterium]|nr:rhamnan synthesis F family protein [Lachnospiraceae bacterium]